MTTKTFLLVGASGAIAQQTAKLLQTNDAKIIGITTKEPADVPYKKIQISQYDFNCFPDLKEPLHGLAYFPGTINLKPFGNLKKSDFERDFQINALGAAACVNKYLPNLKAAGHSSVVFISSVAAQTGMPYHASIAMAKGALEGLTRSLAAEWAPTIRVNAIAPALVQTPLSEKLLNTPEKRELSEKRNPLNLIGQDYDIAQTVVYLISDQSKWVTGQIWKVDGGMSTLKIF
jgi:NAD(P)-dependent dehydrogenase (short-subunit alcohol dehydrogenase family)